MKNTSTTQGISCNNAATIFTLAIIFASTTTLVSASTTGNNTTATTTPVGGEQEAVSSMNTTNNASNALLGRLFSYDEGEDAESNVNPVNETYIVISYSGNRIILPPNATGIINPTETGNVTINIQPNGLSFNQGHAVIMTEGGADRRRRKMQLSALFCSLVQILMAQEVELVLRILAQTLLGS